MKSLNTLEPPAVSGSTQNILSKNGFGCAIVTLEPGEETVLSAGGSGEEHLLFVVEGELTVRNGEINTMLKRNEAHLLPKDDDSTIVATGARSAKFLRVDVPPRQKVDAPLYTIDSGR